jgi:hypothetical protein
MFIPKEILTSNKFALKSDEGRLSGGWVNFKTDRLLTRDNKIKFDFFITAEDSGKALKSFHANPDNTKQPHANQESTLTRNRPLKGESLIAFKYALEDEQNIKIDSQTYSAFSLTLHLAQVEDITYNSIEDNKMKIKYNRLWRKFKLEIYIPLLDSESAYFENFIENIQLQIHLKNKYLEVHSDMSMLFELNQYIMTNKLHSILNDDEVVKETVESILWLTKAKTCKKKKLLAFLNECNKNFKEGNDALLGMSNIEDFKYKLISQTSHRDVVEQMLLEYEKKEFPQIIFEFLFDKITGNESYNYRRNYNYSDEFSEYGAHSEIDWENNEVVDSQALGKVIKLNDFIIIYQTWGLFLNEEKSINETNEGLREKNGLKILSYISEQKKALKNFFSKNKDSINIVRRTKPKASQMEELKKVRTSIHEPDQHFLNNVKKVMNKILIKDIYKPTTYKA